MKLLRPSSATKLMNLERFYALDSFIKATINAHVDCLYEVISLGFALSSNRQLEAKCCEICSIPEEAIEYMRRSVEQQHHLLLEDAAKKLNLYLGYRVRVKNQRSRIDELMQDLAKDEAMMKFEPLYFSEKTIDFYGKKGLSWHGSMVYTRYTTAEKNTATEADDSLLDYVSKK